MLHQLEFYKDIIMIIMNRRIEQFQTIHTLISYPVILCYHIIALLQLHNQKTQTGAAY